MKKQGDHHLSHGGSAGKLPEGPVPFHKRLAVGQKVDGTRDPNPHPGRDHTIANAKVSH